MRNEPLHWVVNIQSLRLQEQLMNTSVQALLGEFVSPSQNFCFLRYRFVKRTGCTPSWDERKQNKKAGHRENNNNNKITKKTTTKTPPKANKTSTEQTHKLTQQIHNHNQKTHTQTKHKHNNNP